MTLARYFTALRNNAGLSLRALSAKVRPKVNATTVWKLEHGRPVKAVTLGQVLRAMGLEESDPEYVKAFVLWSAEQSQTIPAETIERRSRKTNAEAREFVALMRKVTILMRDIPPASWPAVLEALRDHESLTLWIKSRK